MSVLSTPYPRGFRFSPTEAELLKYLRAKINGVDNQSDVIREVDISRVEPWDVKAECNKLGNYFHDGDQFFYTKNVQKYRHGTRTNRASVKGFWKATGLDKPIYRTKKRNGEGDGGRSETKVIGHRKALVFYLGRAPHGQKTTWIMHEYKLGSDLPASPQDEPRWTVCHMFQKDPKSTRGKTVAEESVAIEVKEEPQTDEISAVQQELLLQVGDISVDDVLQGYECSAGRESENQWEPIPSLVESMLNFDELNSVWRLQEESSRATNGRQMFDWLSGPWN